ncbi:MAG: SDR family oxidoreductase [Crocinitomicaceae bacterium]|nr:SDR family oxidoreductase [Crocinitomicaceae bacterium]MBK8926280.1 SDR family oxidoreductase [Crocinitomicaceae bacterium]
MASDLKILLTGSNGLLGQKVVSQLLRQNIDFIATSKGENRNPDCPNQYYENLDITSETEIKNLIEKHQPTCIINTAAMTNVDECEDKEVACQKINVDAVKTLLNISIENNIHLIHVSTDFVFDGLKGPYKETDDRNPLSIYAQSKADSEDILLQSEYKNWAILRTIIVFGQGHNLSRSNIVLWAKEALKSGQELKIVNDQFRAPTWADDLAWACIQTANLNATGIYHISGPETFSIFEMVFRIAEFYGYDKSKLLAVSSETLNQKAKRPLRTGFILDKAKRDLKYDPLTFEESLQRLR